MQIKSEMQHHESQKFHYHIAGCQVIGWLKNIGL